MCSPRPPRLRVSPAVLPSPRIRIRPLAAMLRTLLRDTWTGVLDLVFAPVCVACGEPVPTTETERIVCRVCWARCRALPLPRCRRCWAPVLPDRTPSPLCRACEDWPHALRAVRSAFALGDVTRKLVHALKYQGWEAAARPMAHRMAALAWPDDVRDETRVVVAVPTSPSRMRERGYNQAALLARELALRTGRTFAPDTLVRTRETGTQTALHPGERRANVTGAFAVPLGREGEITGEHVLLADDVWTTGATALACAGALLEAGARAVSAVTFARVFPELERRVPPP